MAFTALFDACVLYPPSVRDVLLSLAVTDLFRTKWTDQIQEEWMEAALRTRPGLSASLRRAQQFMHEAIPDATVTLRQSTDVPDHLLAHLSPLGWEHVNLTGDYVWGGRYSASENTGGLRPLRPTQDASAQAA
jgi:hypothetical protein